MLIKNIKLGQIVVAKSHSGIKIKMSDGEVKENITVAGVVVKVYSRKHAFYIASLNSESQYNNWRRYGDRGFYIDQNHYQVVNIIEPIIDNYVETRNLITVKKETNYSTTRNDLKKSSTYITDNNSYKFKNTTMFVFIQSSTIKLINSMLGHRTPHCLVDDYIYTLLNGEYGSLYDTRVCNIIYNSTDYVKYCKRSLSKAKFKTYELIFDSGDTGFLTRRSSVGSTINEFNNQNNTSNNHTCKNSYDEYGPYEYDELDYDYWDAMIGDDKQC